jgi:hypothetical protein
MLVEFLKKKLELQIAMVVKVPTPPNKPTNQEHKLL